jgi:hypothetical protein
VPFEASQLYESAPQKQLAKLNRSDAQGVPAGACAERTQELTHSEPMSPQSAAATLAQASAQSSLDGPVPLPDAQLAKTPASASANPQVRTGGRREREKNFKRTQLGRP